MEDENGEQCRQFIYNIVELTSAGAPAENESLPPGGKHIQVKNKCASLFFIAGKENNEATIIGCFTYSRRTHTGMLGIIN